MSFTPETCDKIIDTSYTKSKEINFENSLIYLHLAKLINKFKVNKAITGYYHWLLSSQQIFYLLC